MLEILKRMVDESVLDWCEVEGYYFIALKYNDLDFNLLPDELEIVYNSFNDLDKEYGAELVHLLEDDEVVELRQYCIERVEELLKETL
jgi:hypothetical protein